jgi:hypothetical protein
MAPPFRVSDLPGDRRCLTSSMRSRSPVGLGPGPEPIGTGPADRCGRSTASERAGPPPGRARCRAGRPPELQSSATGRRRVWNRRPSPKRPRGPMTRPAGRRRRRAAQHFRGPRDDGTPTLGERGGAGVCPRGACVRYAGKVPRGRVLHGGHPLRGGLSPGHFPPAGLTARHSVRRRHGQRKCRRGGAAPGRAGRPREERPPAGQRPPARVPGAGPAVPTVADLARSGAPRGDGHRLGVDGGGAVAVRWATACAALEQLRLPPGGTASGRARGDSGVILR